MCTCACAQVPQCVWGGQRTVCWSWFSSSTLRVPGIKLRLSRKCLYCPPFFFWACVCVQYLVSYQDIMIRNKNSTARELQKLYKCTIFEQHNFEQLVGHGRNQGENLKSSLESNGDSNRAYQNWSDSVKGAIEVWMRMSPIISDSQILGLQLVVAVWGGLGGVSLLGLWFQSFLPPQYAFSTFCL